ncbi:MAG: CAP domain-containing protein [Chloroflexota bacterium]
MHMFQATLAGTLVLLGTVGTAPPAFAAPGGALAPQIVSAVNQDRLGSGLAALTVDPRLTLVAEARAQYLINQGFFSHCTGGEADTNCPLSGDDFVPRDQAAGIGLQVSGTIAGENLALNNYPTATAAAQTNSAWLNSPEHKANIMDTRYTSTGVGAICCFTGSVGGQQVTLADNVTVSVQEFAGGPGAVAPTTPAAAVPAATPPSGIPTAGGAMPAGACQYILGFAALHGLDSVDTGGCRNDQRFAPNGDAQQTTANGLMAWRKVDNWTAFTNGYWTWINGPEGLAKRLNTQRFPWEANPDGLAVAP